MTHPALSRWNPRTFHPDPERTPGGSPAALPMHRSGPGCGAHDQPGHRIRATSAAARPWPESPGQPKPALTYEREGGPFITRSGIHPRGQVPSTAGSPSTRPTRQPAATPSRETPINASPTHGRGDTHQHGGSRQRGDTHKRNQSTYRVTPPRTDDHPSSRSCHLVIAGGVASARGGVRVDQITPPAEAPRHVVGVTSPAGSSSGSGTRRPTTPRRPRRWTGRRRPPK